MTVHVCAHMRQQNLNLHCRMATILLLMELPSPLLPLQKFGDSIWHLEVSLQELLQVLSLPCKSINDTSCQHSGVLIKSLHAVSIEPKEPANSQKLQYLPPKLPTSQDLVIEHFTELYTTYGDGLRAAKQLAMHCNSKGLSGDIEMEVSSAMKRKCPVELLATVQRCPPLTPMLNTRLVT